MAMADKEEIDEATQPEVSSETQVEIAESTIPKLPIEILAMIVDVVWSWDDRERHRTKTMLSVARVNSTMYDLAIPKIYKTVQINKRNWAKISHGHGGTSERLEGDALPGPSPTRKDLAAAFTHRLELQDMPQESNFKHYRAVNEFEIGTFQNGNPIEPLPLYGLGSLFDGVLAEIMSKGKADSLHVRMTMPRYINDDQCRVSFLSLKPVAPCTFEFHEVQAVFPGALRCAYDMQAVVYLHDTESWEPEPDLDAFNIAARLDECFKDEDANVPAGQLFLCDVSSTVLTPQEQVHGSLENDEIALNKLCGLVKVWPNLDDSPYMTQLEFLRSRVRFVHWPFRPSVDDLFARPQRVPEPVVGQGEGSGGSSDQ